MSPGWWQIQWLLVASHTEPRLRERQRLDGENGLLLTTPAAIGGRDPVRIRMMPDHLSIVANRILDVRGQRVILDRDLAVLYGVTVRRLNEQIRRNRDRFPDGFMLVLTNQEVANLKSQIATSSWGGKRKPPLAFTEHGAIMAATVSRVDTLDVDTRKQFDQVYEAILGLMSPTAKKQ